MDCSEKATDLAISLKGAAATVLTNLPPEKRHDYAALTTVLDSRFGATHQTELNRMRLKSRTRRRDETLAELADVECLTCLPYPGATEDMIQVLAQDQFIDALVEEDMRLHIHQDKPATLRDALRIALELESCQLASRQNVKYMREAQLLKDGYAVQQQVSTATAREDVLQWCCKFTLIQKKTRQRKCPDLLGVWRERPPSMRVPSAAEEAAGGGCRVPFGKREVARLVGKGQLGQLQPP